jgi:hypothetical protein
MATSDINPFEEIATRAGHASAGTTFVHYFHTFELPLRWSLDRAIADVLSWPSVKRYLTMKHDDYRKRCSRMVKRTIVRSAGEAALLLLEPYQTRIDQLPDVDAGVHLMEPVVPARLGQQTPTSLLDVIHILKDIQAGIAGDAIGSRCACSTGLIHAISAAGTKVLQRLGEMDPRIDYGESDENLVNLHTVLAGSVGTRVVPQDAEQAKLSPLREYLAANIPSEMTLAGLASWQSCYHKGYVSLLEPALASGFVTLLEAAAMPRERIVIRHASSPAAIGNSASQQTSETLEHVRILSIFGATGGVAPNWDSISPRRGRPSSYLVISSVKPVSGCELPSAAVGIGGLNALLLCAYILIHIHGRSVGKQPVSSAVQGGA